MPKTALSRRAFLSCTSKAGVITLGALVSHPRALTGQMEQAAPAYQSFTAHQGRTIEALAERIFPADELGPGATDARVIDYIDRALATYHASYKEDYLKGIEALDAFCTATRGKRFVELATGDQNRALVDIDRREPPPEWPADAGIGARAFLYMVIEHTMEGMFCDPSYGGNHNEIGWKLIRFPGTKAFGYDPPFGYYDMTIPEIEYPPFKPYAGPNKSRRIGEKD